MGHPAGRRRRARHANGSSSRILFPTVRCTAPDTVHGRTTGKARARETYAKGAIAAHLRSDRFRASRSRAVRSWRAEIEPPGA